MKELPGSTQKKEITEKYITKAKILIGSKDTKQILILKGCQGTKEPKLLWVPYSKHTCWKVYLTWYISKFKCAHFQQKYSEVCKHQRHIFTDMNIKSTFCIQRFRTWRFNKPRIKNIQERKFPESSKMQTLNVWHAKDYLHNSYIALGIISNLELT